MREKNSPNIIRVNVESERGKGSKLIPFYLRCEVNHTNSRLWQISSRGDHLARICCAFLTLFFFFYLTYTFFFYLISLFFSAPGVGFFFFLFVRSWASIKKKFLHANHEVGLVLSPLCLVN